MLSVLPEWSSSKMAELLLWNVDTPTNIRQCDAHIPLTKRMREQIKKPNNNVKRRLKWTATEGLNLAPSTSKVDALS